VGRTALDSESTGILRPVPTPLHFTFVLVVPTFGVSTAQAYADLDYRRIARHRAGTEEMIQALTAGDWEGVVRNMHNDFESTVFGVHPRLAALKKEIMELGGCSAVLSGSGSTMVGVARDEDHARELKSKLEGREQVDRVLVTSSLGKEHNA
jgi:4-diphosphocytidyl-2-C-methyl-D-erythritol kinase